MERDNTPLILLAIFIVAVLVSVLLAREPLRVIAENIDISFK